MAKQLANAVLDTNAVGAFTQYNWLMLSNTVYCFSVSLYNVPIYDLVCVCVCSSSVPV